MQAFLNSKELAALLKVKESYLRDARSLGNIPYYRIGRQVRYDADEIAKWIKSGDSSRTIPRIVEQAVEGE